MAFNDRLKEARLSKGYTQEHLANLIGVAKSTLTGYEKGNSEPSMLIIKNIMNALEIDANYLWTDEIDKDTTFVATPKEREIIKKYRTLDEYGQKAIDLVLEHEIDRCTTIKEEQPAYSFVMKPSYQAKLSAGTGQYVFDDIPTDLIEVPEKYSYIDFVIKVDGDSMEPEYSHDDKVMIKKEKVHPGEIGAFVVDGEAYIKQLGENELISINKAYPNIEIKEGMRVDCMGKVVGKLEGNTK